MRGIKDWNLFMSFPVLVRHHDKELSRSSTLNRCLEPIWTAFLHMLSTCCEKDVT